MAQFKGTIRLEDGDSLETTLMVDSGRFIAKAGEHELGNWAVGELSVERRNNEFRIKVEDDELVVGVADPVGLSQILGVNEQKPKDRRDKKPKASKPKRKERSRDRLDSPTVATPAVTAAPVFVAEPSLAAAPSTASEEATPLWARIPKRWKLAGLGLIGILVFFVLAPNLLALVMMLAGVVTLFLAIAAKGESGTGILPPPFFGTTAAIGGGIGSVLLSLLIMVTR